RGSRAPPTPPRAPPRSRGDRRPRRAPLEPPDFRSRRARRSPCPPRTGNLPGVGRLVLWDIDGTLVDSAGLGRDAFLEAFERVTGAPPDRLVPFAGRTDMEIALDLLETAGIDHSEQLLGDFESALAAAMAERAPLVRQRGRAFPGVREVLERDTPLDIAAAIEGGARAVGVATGPYGEDDLRHAGADAVLPDLSDLDSVLGAVLG